MKAKNVILKFTLKVNLVVPPFCRCKYPGYALPIEQQYLHALSSRFSALSFTSQKTCTFKSCTVLIIHAGGGSKPAVYHINAGIFITSNNDFMTHKGTALVRIKACNVTMV